MFQINSYLSVLLWTSVLGFITWLISIKKNNVAIIDVLWPNFFLCGATIFLLDHLDNLSARSIITYALISIWSLRLSLHLLIRNWGQAEDRRYQKIRKNNEPYFWLKSIYIIFAFQIILAWIICLPLMAGIFSNNPLNVLDYIGIGLVLFGFYWEMLGDYQLQKFKSNPKCVNQVLNTGLWKYTRHPNYFGEACVWWGFFIIALAVEAWWSIPSPILITFLLIKVTGVNLLESEISNRRPEYKEYLKTTNAFIPWKRNK